MWVADSETSALRAVRFPGVKSRAVPGVTGPESVPNAEPRVETAVGLGLFDFGFVDGTRGQARMQHCLGVAVLPDDSVAIADTYNGAIRRFDPATAELTTLTRGLQEPSDVLVEHTEDGARLIVVEANAHRLIRVPLPEQAQRVNEGAMKTARAATMLAGETLELIARFSAPTGQKLDNRWGDPTQLTVDATPPEFILDGAGVSQGGYNERSFSTRTLSTPFCIFPPAPPPVTVNLAEKSPSTPPATSTSKTGRCPSTLPEPPTTPASWSLTYAASTADRKATKKVYRSVGLYTHRSV